MSSIADPKSYFQKLGGLHDARVEGFEWQKKSHRLSIWVDDINSNSADLPGYGGELPAELIFNNVEILDVDLRINTDSFSIYGLGVEVREKGFRISIEFAPGGKMRFMCTEVIVNGKEK
jgi:hypothetical protein